MNNQDYETKKRECWEKFKRENLDGEVQWQPVSRYDVFCAAFDRAYALGKQTEAIMQEEIEKAANEYANSLCECGMYDKETPATKEDMAYAFKAGANFAFGKQEKDAEAVIQGWVAIDKDKNLFFYRDKPKRVGSMLYWIGEVLMELDNSLFPDLTWESEPQECEIILKRKKK